MKNLGTILEDPGKCWKNREKMMLDSSMKLLLGPLLNLFNRNQKPSIIGPETAGFLTTPNRSLAQNKTAGFNVRFHKLWPLDVGDGENKVGDLKLGEMF